MPISRRNPNELYPPKPKDLAYYLSLPYPIKLSKADDGSWVASITMLRGCEAHSTDREDALRLIDDAKKLWLESALAKGAKIPEPLQFGAEIKRSGDCH
jgi:predicted RNase H-like HicB family nuclease